ncbi:DUF4340 domain-containing protein [Metapseudomonas furukawaii]|uniref:DUF4340 domain-containing protein n=1 Tax=Metapseudomonas furukawaii TaxID=1149133 RepID=A0AAD1C3P7_METFU|nr:DUF4340 domain-containing protein [Pseudomonas furukawaii]ELS25572.1 hypothetical protein ppKF707_0668 [Pseudomonas furukawaii]BAU76238.1 hypothetical protein KF707C_45500 [Pseudomonas furukawaii]
MGRKGLIILALLVAGLGTAYFIQQERARPQSLPATANRESLLPELQGALKGLTALDIRSPGLPEIRLERQGDGWVIPAKAGYPAADPTVAGLLRALADARKVEAKTANPELHGRVGLAEKGAPEEQGTRLKLERGDGEPLELLVGKPAQQGKGQLVRLYGDNQVWLIDQALLIPASELGWLDRRVVAIPFASVRQVEVVYPSGNTLTVFRDSADEPNLRVKQLPKGRRLAYEAAANGMATLFAGLDFADNAPLAQVQFKGKPALRFSLSTFDGGELKGEVYQQGEQPWLVLKGRDRLDDAKVPGKMDWAYRLESFQYQALAKKLEDVLAAK